MLKPKVMSAAGIAKLRSEGTPMERETRKVEVQGIGAVVAEFKRMADSMDAIAKKRNDDLMGAIDKLTTAISRKELRPIDLGPLVQAVAGLKQEVIVQQPKKVPYDFDMIRDNRGLISTVRATPVIEEMH